MSSSAPSDGESPAFVASSPPFPGFQAYCTMSDGTGIISNPPLLALNQKSDAFSLCQNDSTLNQRIDLVFSPVTGHPHYILGNCQPVSLKVITGN
ncbi:hypothetical protein BD779DRAFT_1671592 [Infundibulicybe gibba]|nr:hypothetical protein BD779DRAFT_1671592 [Infundibulicybe gibba]